MVRFLIDFVLWSLRFLCRLFRLFGWNLCRFILSYLKRKPFIWLELWIPLLPAEGAFNHYTFRIIWFSYRMREIFIGSNNIFIYRKRLSVRFRHKFSYRYYKKSIYSYVSKNISCGLFTLTNSDRQRINCLAIDLFSRKKNEIWQKRCAEATRKKIIDC